MTRERTRPQAVRLLAAPTPAHRDHVATFGERPAVRLGDLISELERAGLGGRGGAGFPAHRKLAAVAEHARRRGRPVIVGNGTEGESLSGKDKALLTRTPHLVLDGLLVCADALGAKDVHLVVDAVAESSVRAALAERPDGRRVRVLIGTGSFVGGEASALVGLVAGRRPLPADTRVRLAESGVRRAPTLVQNVETLAHIALIARFGADWHRGLGTADDPGTRLVSISVAGAATDPVVLEVPGGTPLRSVMAAASPPTDAAAALVGGFHGAWLPASAFDAPLSPAGLSPWEAAPGAGIVHVLPHGRCGVQATAQVLATLAAASARQCGPCLNGLPRLAELMRRQLAGHDVREELARVAGLVDGRGACHHPDGTVRMLRSALRVFADDLAAHAAHACTASREVLA